MQGVFGSMIVCGALLVGYPFLPLLGYDLALPSPSYPYKTQLSSLPTPDDLLRGNLLPRASNLPSAAENAGKPEPVGNRVVLPTIGVDIAVVEGGDERALNRGAWRIPGTSSDPQTSNMVISAHRFRYRPPSSKTFYLLNKMKEGDPILLYWNGKEYDYRVAQTAVVAPTAMEILRPTQTATLTLFTCTPLFSTAQRLVVIAEPIAQ